MLPSNISGGVGGPADQYLPWQNGQRVRVNQGNNGSFSHYTKWTRYGWDFGLPPGAPVRAAIGGTVVKAGWDPTGWGITVVVRTDDGTCSRYAHLMNATVAVNRPVSRYDVVGHVDSTGNSTGTHLHYQRQLCGSGVALPSAFVEAAVPRTGQLVTSRNSPDAPPPSTPPPPSAPPPVSGGNPGGTSLPPFQAGVHDTSFEHEVGSPNWATLNGGTNQNDVCGDGTAYNGSCYLDVSASSAPYNTFYQDLSYSPSPGQCFTLSAWYRSHPPGAAISATLAIWVLGSGSAQSASTNFVVGNGWTHVTATMRTPGGAAWSRLRGQLYIGSPGRLLDWDLTQWYGPYTC